MKIYMTSFFPEKGNRLFDIHVVRGGAISYDGEVWKIFVTRLDFWRTWNTHLEKMNILAGKESAVFRHKEF